MVSQQLDDLLAPLIDRRRCVLCYDQTLVEQLPHILVEQHGIRDSAAARSDPRVRSLFDRVDPGGEAAYEISELPGLLRHAGVDEGAYTTQGEVPEEDRGDFRQFSEEGAHEAKQAVIELQRSVGSNTYKGTAYATDLLEDRKLHKYFRRVSPLPPTPIESLLGSDYWSLRLRWWKAIGVIDGSLPSLSIGPRWLTEIRYFREVLKFRGHIGLDLHSSDEELIKTGDMHEMPFEEDSFGLVFIRNTIDKSYDIRLLVSELIRVAAPGGVIAIEGGCYMGLPTVLHRASIQKAENLLPIIGAQARHKVLACQTVALPASRVPPGSPTTHYARLAVRLRS